MMFPVRARAGAFAVAAVFAAAIAHDVWRIPVQVSDSLTEILDAQRSPSLSDTFVASATNAAYLRPLRVVQIKALFDVAHGRYYLAYRGFHVLLVVALLWLFTRALRVETAADLAASVFALTVLTGLHTFLGFVREAFPINHFLEVAVLSVAALNLAQSRGGWWVDVAACLLFLVAALTLETGLLVWVVVTAAWIAGLRGISARGLAAITLLFAAYFVVRFGYLHTGVPSLAERGSGFLLERLEPHELQQRFGDGPLLFYAYNVAASVLSVLFSEPRDGLLVAARAWRDGDVAPRVYLAVATSLATTMTIAWWAVARWRRWWQQRDPIGTSERLAIVAGAVLAANAALSYAYTKDEIVAVAGVFYALAAYGAVRAAAERAATLPRAGVIVASALLFVLASAWAVRSFSVHHVLRRQAFRMRNEWAHVQRNLEREGRWPEDPQARAVIEQLRERALQGRVPNSQLLAEWHNRWFGD
jgi:hypothetical protein